MTTFTIGATLCYNNTTMVTLRVTTNIIVSAPTRLTISVFCDVVHHSRYFVDAMIVPNFNVSSSRIFDALFTSSVKQGPKSTNGDL